MQVEGKPSFLVEARQEDGVSTIFEFGLTRLMLDKFVMTRKCLNFFFFKPVSLSICRALDVEMAMQIDKTMQVVYCSSV